MRVAFGPWEPDSATVDAQVLADAKNVYPARASYTPVNSLQTFDAFALPSPCKGLFSARTNAGTFKIFAGTTTKLYLYSAVNGWVDYSRVAGGNYHVRPNDFWSFAQFGGQVIACNIDDVPQVIDIETAATNFAALGGSPPQARYVTIVNQYVILACQSSALDKLTNSAINSAVGWTVGVNQCDEQTFPDGGDITGIAGGDYGWVVQEHSIRRMIFQPGFDQAFRFERIERERGAWAPYSVVGIANTLFFRDHDGFYAFQDKIVPIGSQRVDKWFNDNCPSANAKGIYGIADPLSTKIFWSFQSSGSASSSAQDRLLIYDWYLDKWSYATHAAACWAPLTTVGVTLESLDTVGTLD